MKNVKRFLIILLSFVLSMFIFNNSKVNALDSENDKMFEFRGGWVATVSNIDIGKQTGTTEAAINAYKNEFINILNVFEEYNMNSVIFQVRPINDAFYQSEINPWSRFLIGTEGVDPGWDPMAWMIEETHKRNMEFHAWLNPYRASLGVLPVEGDYSTALNNYLKTLDDKNFAKNNPDLLIRGVHDKNTGDARILLNPSKEKVREHVYDTIEEIVRNYNVDAIHFDDYFYNGVDHTEDNADHQAYVNQGGTLSKNDWRREQVNILIQNIGSLIDNLNVELNTEVEFGISPAGVWAPADNMGCGAYGQPGGMTGISCYSYSSYIDLFADTRKWVREEWIDYILPQNYGNLQGNHKGITSWWANEVKDVDVKLYIGLAPYQYNESNQAWPLEEMENQMLFADSFNTVSGFAMYNITQLRNPSNNTMREAMNVLKDRWSQPVFNPIKNLREVDIYQLPTVSSTRNSNHVNLQFEGLDTAHGYVVYRTLEGENFDINTANVFDIVYNREGNFEARYSADNLKSYNFYIKTLYKDGTIRSSFKELTTGIYDYNKAPKIDKVQIESDLLVINNKSFITISGEASDFNNDDLKVKIQLVSSGFNRTEDNISVVDGKFSKEIYLPPISFNRGYFIVTVTDGTDSTTRRTYSFYAPKGMYTELMQYVMTIEIITNDTVNNIYK